MHEAGITLLGGGKLSSHMTTIYVKPYSEKQQVHTYLKPKLSALPPSWNNEEGNSKITRIFSTKALIYSK